MPKSFIETKYGKGLIAAAGIGGLAAGAGLVIDGALSAQANRASAKAAQNSNSSSAAAMAAQNSKSSSVVPIAAQNSTQAAMHHR